MRTTAVEQQMSTHYERSDLANAILNGVRALGKDPTTLTPDDLAAVDQFHSRGKVATLALAARAGISGNMRVLDVGGGIGGAARTLASTFGCAVTVLDLTESYCQAGELLTAYMGLSDQVSFRHGSALEIPFPEASFDVVWTQHSSMNIADKAGLYAEIGRVLRPGGQLALHEIMAGPISPVQFPVPWASQPEMSFLASPEEMQTIITANGFQTVEWVDETAITRQWFQERLATAPAPGTPPPALGLHLLLGPDAGIMLRNLALNLQEQRIIVAQGVFDRH